MAAVATFLQSTNNTANQTTYTFSTQNLGTAAADRYIAVVASGAVTTGTGSVASVTVQGISATQAVSKVQAVNVANVISIWLVAVPTGTTGDVVITMGSGSQRCAIALYSCVGLGSATAYDTATDDTATGTNPVASSTIDCEANGFIIAASMINNAATTSSNAWTGVTEDYEQVLESNSWISGGSDEFATLQTGLTVTSSWTNNNVNAEASLVAASWSGGGASTTIKSYNGTITANVKTVLNGTAIASRKTWNSIT